MQNNWNVSYATYTPESIELGDAEERGFEAEGVSFRDAIGYFGYPYLGEVQADSWPLSLNCAPRWLTHSEQADFRTGESRELDLLIPEQITPSSRMRIARLVGCLGAERKA